MTASVVPAELRNPPPPAARRWVEQAVGPGSRVVRVRRLRNAFSAAMHTVDVDAAGVRHRLVLRRWARTDLAPDDGVVENEARALTVAARSAVAVPRLVAADPSGAECGVPAVLMTRLPGRDVLAPPDLDRFLDRLVSTLHTLHATPLPDGELGPYDPWCDMTEPPAWMRRPEIWSRAIEIVQRRVPDVALGLCHRDYHPGNVLWTRGQVSGVVDWTHACRGAPAADVAHCALNLAVLFGNDVADEFARRYGPIEELRWFAAAHAVSWGDSEPTLWRWHDAGRTDITRAALIDAVEEFLARAVS